MKNPPFSPHAGAARDALFKGELDLDASWQGVWPRLFIGPGELTQRALLLENHPDWRAALLPVFDKPQPPGPRYQEPFGYEPGADLRSYDFERMARLALCYRLTGREVYLDAARRFLPILSQAIEKSPLPIVEGNQDLDIGHYLYFVALSYDWLKGQTPADEEAILRRALAEPTRRTFEWLREHKTEWRYDQNHDFIPVGGIGLAALALWGEEDEALRWAAFARNYMARSCATICADGFFYEGISYLAYVFHWHVDFSIALARLTGENWLDDAPFRDVEKFVAHCVLPTRQNVFDFADAGPRVGQNGWDAPWHSLKTQFRPDCLYGLQKYAAPNAALEAVIEGLRHDSPSGSLVEMLWANPPAKNPVALGDELPRAHYFSDHEAIFWRSSWSDLNATAFMLKCGPPEGHRAAQLVRAWPEWKMNAGHAHPDAGMFLLFSRGKWLAGDTGYTAVKRTGDHNCLLIDGQGHFGDGRYHAFDDVDYATLDQIRFQNVKLSEDGVRAEAVLERAYDSALWMSRVRRHIEWRDGRFLILRDEFDSRDEHVYSFLWHSDTPPIQEAPGRWRIESGAARLVLHCVAGLECSVVAPAIVPAYEMTPDQGTPQQRGWRLEIQSPRARSHTFVHVAEIEGENASWQDVLPLEIRRSGLLNVGFHPSQER